MNAKQEFLQHIQRIQKRFDQFGVLCAQIKFGDDWSTYEGRKEYYTLTTGYTQEEWQQFLSDIDKNYNSVYGLQNLFGTIWYNDGTWSSRGEYDGSEWWQYNQAPAIPEHLNRIDKVRDKQIDKLLHDNTN